MCASTVSDSVYRVAPKDHLLLLALLQQCYLVRTRRVFVLSESVALCLAGNSIIPSVLRISPWQGLRVPTNTLFVRYVGSGFFLYSVRFFSFSTHFLLVDTQLHTCAACEQSGAKKESVRCMRCPVAYHTSCIPKNCVQNFPGKRIICPKHEGSDRGTTPVVVATVAVEAAARDKKVASDAKSSKAQVKQPPQVHSDTETQRAVERRSENEDDMKSEASATSGMSSSTKKLSKSTKREKKKKKKKRKKLKKRELKDRVHGDNDEEDEESAGGKRASTRTDSDDDDDDNDDGASDAGIGVKHEKAYSESINIPAISATYAEAASPATSTSLFESPGKFKARLDEALGQSDDELDSMGNPSPLPKAKSREDARLIGAVSINSKETGDLPASAKTASAKEELSTIKRELPSPPPAPPAKSEYIEHPSSSSSIPSHATLPSSGNAGRDESGQSASDSFSTGQSSAEKKSTKSERKVRKESLSSSSGGKDSIRQSLFKDASDRKSSKKQKHGYSGLSLEIPGSPMKSGLSSSRDSATHDPSLKDSVSEGEEGDDEGPGGSSTPSSRRRASVGTPRSDAIDNLKGQLAGSTRISKKKKKKKTKSANEVSTDTKRDEKQGGKRSSNGEDEDDKDEENEEEAKWVQCDSCKKWRTVPKDIDLNSMPDRWYCKMNTWDTGYASCTVAEEVVDAASKKRKSGSHGKRSSVKIKVKQQTDDPHPATAATLSDGDGSSHSSGSGSYTSKKTAVETVEPSTADEKGSKLSKKQEKQAKKRKLKLKLKEKYREVKWVQCESAQCGKWRVVPSSIDFNLLPAVWYCHLNTWAPEIAKCTAPNPPEVDTFLLKSQSKKGASSSSARPTKKFKPAGDISSSVAVAVSETPPGVQPAAPSSAEMSTKSVKSGKVPKGTTPTASQSVASNADNVPPATPSGTHSGGATAGGQIGSSGGAPGSSLPAQPNSQALGGFSSSVPIGGGKGRKVKPDGIKKAMLEWAQCEKCNKWRKLPQHIKSSTLPDKWYCSMNHWDPTRASCSIPEEVDQEPLGASPLPSSQNWYPMPGQVGGGNNGGSVGGFRSKRGKLSYSELLYASTGQLRKTYTSESSTLSFEHAGRTYHRDDQYKDSSMYVSPDSMLLNTKRNATSAEPSGSIGNGKLATSTNVDADGFGKVGDGHMGNQPSVEQISTSLLEIMDLRHSSTVTELVRAVNGGGKLKDGGHSDVAISLSLITAALNHLVHRGFIEKVEGENEIEETADDDESGQVGVKRRKMSGAPFARLQYRKVPKRPLKASKCWKFGQSPFEFPLKE